MPAASLSGTLGRLRADLVVYGALLAVPKILVVLTVPLYTRGLTTTEYAALQLGIAGAMVLAPVFTIGMDAAQSYFFFLKQWDGSLARPQVVSAVLRIRVVWGGLVFAAVLAALMFLPRGTFRSTAFPWYLLAATAAVFLEQINGQAADIFRLQHRPLAYACTVGLQSLGGAALGVLLGLMLGWGVTGVFAGAAIAAGVTAAGAWLRHRALLTLEGTPAFSWPRLLGFGFPIMPAAFCQMVLLSMDRWLLVSLSHPDDVAVYGAGAELAAVISLAAAGFRAAWWPIAMAEIHEGRTEVIARVSRLYVGIAAMLGVVSAYGFPFVTRWLLPSQYAAASDAASIIPWRWLCYGFIMIVSVGTWKSERTWWNVAPVIIGIAVNGVAGGLLIPSWGIAGAAWSGVAGSLAWVIATMIISERLYHIGYAYRAFAVQTVVGLAATATLVWLTPARPGGAVGRLAVLAMALLAIGATLRQTGSRPAPDGRGH